MPIVLSVLLGASGLVYCAVLFLLFLGLFRLKEGKNTAHPSVSVVVPAKDEEGNIGKCLSDLMRQTYPPDRYEVVVVDDRSEDRTGEIVRSFERHHRNVRLVRVERCPPGMSPKKHAVKQGITASRGEIVLSTDADCRMAPGWIAGLMRVFEPDVGIVVGLTEYDLKGTSHRFLQKLQALDFLSHSFCAAGSIGIGWAVNANANNLAYRRAAFEEVGGFQDVTHLVSGDDDLLVQRVGTRTSWKIRFAISEETFVRTKPVETFKDFVHQRIRWASKGLHYRPSLVGFLGATFLFFLLLLFSVPFSLANGAFLSVPVLCLMAKVGFESMIIAKGCSVFKRKGMLRTFLAAEVVHIPYILGAAIGGHFFKFQWKGQRMGKTVPNRGRSSCGRLSSEGSHGS